MDEISLSFPDMSLPDISNFCRFPRLLMASIVYFFRLVMSNEAAKYDLSAKIIPYVDKHLALPMVDFLIEKKLYSEEQLTEIKYTLLTDTKMIDCIIDEYKKMHKTEQIPADLTTQKTHVLKEMEKLKKAIGPFADMLEKSKFDAMREANEFTVENLSQKYNATVDHVNALYKYGRLMFDVGSYREAYTSLTIYRFVADDEEESYMALWGKLAAGLVDGDNWDAVLEDARMLRDTIEQRARVSPAEQIQQRTWFLHWILFFSFNHVGARSLLLECLHGYNANSYNPQNSEKMLNTVQLNAPHLLRYLSVAAVTASRQPVVHQQFILKRSPMLRELVRVLAVERTNYSDPITEFVYNLLVEFDFAAAAQALKDAVPVLQNDFFLSSDATQKEFYEAARALFVDTYARVHTEMEVKALLAEYNLALPLVEEVSAEIKLQAPAILKTTSIHQQIRDRARVITSRSNSIMQQIRM